MEELMSNEELVGSLLGCKDAGSAVLDYCGGIERLSELSISELCGVCGVGPVRAQRLRLVFELHRRLANSKASRSRIGDSQTVYSLFQPMFACERVEVFRSVSVNSKLRVISHDLVSRGTVSASVVHPREAFRSAVRNMATGVIFIHNHPSGDPKPSSEDRALTERLCRAGEILGIPVLDHVIVGSSDSYYSFADSGMIEQNRISYKPLVLK